MFTTEYTLGVVMVRVYNLNTGHREVWDTNITSQSPVVHVSFSAGFIVVSAGRDIYVHNKDRVLLYSVTPDQVSEPFIQAYVSDTGVFWGTFSERYKLFIMNLSTKDSKISTVGIVRARGVSGTRNGYVYVTDDPGAEVGVYSSDGTFLYRLQIDPPEEGGSLWYCGAISLSPTEDLIAFFTWDDTTPFAVYRTQA